VGAVHDKGEVPIRENRVIRSRILGGGVAGGAAPIAWAAANVYSISH